MSNQIPPQVLSYHPAELQPGAIGIHSDGDETVIVIAPVSTIRLMLSQMIPIGALSVLVWFLSFVWLELSPGAEDGFILGLPVAGCTVLLVVLLMRFIPIARFGRIATVFRVSRRRLDVIAPALGRRGRKTWPAEEVLDTSIRHAGAFPVLMQFIRLQISLTDDRVEVLLIPSPEGQPLGILESTLREALQAPNLRQSSDFSTTPSRAARNHS